MNEVFKVGDRVMRKQTARYNNRNHDPKHWTGTILEKTPRVEYVYRILTDSGKDTTWSSVYFELWTPLKELL